MAKDEEREVFACFGSAFLHANTFEISLAKVIVHFDYLQKTLDAARRGEIATFNEETFFSDFDAFLEKLFAMTMGELIKRVNALTALDVQLAGRIKTALEKRNFLTHHFFREWAEISAFPLGCQRMGIFSF